MLHKKNQDAGMKISSRIARLGFVLWLSGGGCNPVFAISLSSQVDYTYIHGLMTFSNPLFTSVASGSFSGNTASVTAGSSLTLTGAANITDTNNSYCPGCIIQEYVAWIPRGAVQTGTPNNIGIYSGGILSDIPIGTFTWTTNAPTQGGIYYIGAASTLDYVYQTGALGTTGNNYGTTNSDYASYQVTVYGANAINSETLSIASDGDLGPAPAEPTANFLSLDNGILNSTATFTLNANRGVTLNAGGGTFDVAGNTALTYPGVMSGSGALTKQGSGTLILSGSNSYTGGTTVSAGTLQGDSNSLQGNITNNASVIFDQANNGTYAGNISGSGALTKEGAGVLTLAGNNSYQGVTHINAGGLAFSSGYFGGTLINDGTVIDTGSGLTLSGAVSGGGNYLGNVNFAGSFLPGHSPALVNVQNITFADTNTLIMELGGLTRGSQYDAINASGTVALGGTLDLKLINGFVPQTGNQFNLIAAQNISNQFKNVLCNFSPNTVCALVNDGKNLTLQINDVLAPGSPLLSIEQALPQQAMNRLTPLLNQPGGLAAYQAALNEIAPKQQSAAAASSNITGQTQIANITQHLMENRAQVTGMSGAQNHQKLAMMFNGIALPTNLLATLAPQYNNAVSAGNTDYEDLQSGLSVFLNAQFDFTDRNTSVLQRGFHSNTYGVTGGVDYRLSQRILVGLATGYSNAATQVTAQGGNQTLNSYSLSGFSSINLTDNWYVDLMANGAYNQFQTTRNIHYVDAVGTVNTAASGSTDGLQSRYSVNMGYDIPYREWSFGMRGRSEYGQTNINGYQEQGADLGLNVNYKAQTLDTLTTDLGAVVSKVTSTAIGVFSSQLILEWEHQYLNNSRLINSYFINTQNSNFTTQTDTPDRDYMNISTAISAQLPHGGSAFIQYRALVDMRYTSQHSINLGIRYEF